MKISKTSHPQFSIWVGEKGNEDGRYCGSRDTQQQAIRSARAYCRAYRGDGWWLVVGADGSRVYNGRYVS